MIWDVITVALVLWAISALKSFEFLYAFGGLNMPQSLYTVGIYLYVMGFGKRDPIYRLGYATAIGVLLLIISRDHRGSHSPAHSARNNQLLRRTT